MSIKEMYEAIRAGTVNLDEFEQWVDDRELNALDIYLGYLPRYNFTETD